MYFVLLLFYAAGLILAVFGAFSLVYYPLALIAEIRRRPNPIFQENPPLISIIIPAYNEEKVIAHCIESILKSGYPRLELIMVDDGSKDNTYAIMKKYELAQYSAGYDISGNPYDYTFIKKKTQLTLIKAISQANAGKAAALNRGVLESHGELLFFVDADGMFTRRTIPEMLKQFTSPKVGGVCGNDSPVNLNRLQTRLICLQTHVSTSFVRRALAEINCLPIISGNIGVFRRIALKATVLPPKPVITYSAGETWPEGVPGPFVEGFLGEDLELTWRIHRAGYKVNFAPQAIVFAEVPSTIGGLWRQRVRWARGYLQTVSMHRDMFFRPRYGWISLYLPVNTFNQVFGPILQLIALGLLIALIATGNSPVSPGVLNLLLYFGLGFALLATVYGIILDRAWKDLRLLYVLPLWIFYSVLLDFVMIWAILLELFGAKSKWNKLERTGVVSREEV
jgi:cellulose synthase/poly-beta-1,6-N-acetylglucosamine synthase-like glycosyltransferase